MEGLTIEQRVTVLEQRAMAEDEASKRAWGWFNYLLDRALGDESNKALPQPPAAIVMRFDLSIRTDDHPEWPVVIEVKNQGEVRGGHGVRGATVAHAAERLVKNLPKFLCAMTTPKASGD